MGKLYQSQLTGREVAPRFRAAFRRQEALDERLGWRTSAERERERWREIVAEVLPDANPPASCFEALHDHYAQPGGWKVHPQARQVLASLSQRGYALGMCSNFDSRLRAVVAGFSELAPLGTLAISSEVGWRKPARAFFEHLAHLAGLPAHEILVVGDDPANDLAGARAASMPALLVDPDALPADPDRISSLEELLTRLP